MKTITIESEYSCVFDMFGLELITSCGIVQFSGVYVKRENAARMAEHFYKLGWLNTSNNIRYKVYQVNITELAAFV